MSFLAPQRRRPQGTVTYIETLAKTPLSQPAPSFLDFAPRVDHYRDPWDISDVWADEVENITGAIVCAYFDHNFDGDRRAPTFAGLSFDDGHGVSYYSAEHAIAELGVATVVRLERVYSDEVNA